MQISNIPSFKKKITQKIPFQLIRWLLFLGCMTGVVWHLQDKSLPTWSQWKTVWTYPHAFKMIAVVLLIPFNWSLEALKWQSAIRYVQPSSFWTCWHGVLTGVLMSFFTPQTIGDFAGRSMHLPALRRWQVADGLLVSNFTQLFITGTFGAMAILSYLKALDWLPSAWYKTMVASWCLVALLIGLTFLAAKEIWKSLPNYAWKTALKPYLMNFAAYTWKDLAWLTCLSLCRYMVFAAQFLLVISAFEVKADWTILWNGVAFIFVMKSVLPTLNSLGDLGVREFSAVAFFQLFDVPTEKIIAASLLLWSLNILLPALLGFFSFVRVLFFRKNE